MKTAVIYYSFAGNSALVAETIRAAAGADLFEIKIPDAKKRSGIAKIIWFCSQMMKGKKVPIEPLKADVNAYDLIILGTPVWAGAPAPAMLSFLDKTAIKGKKIALFCCHGGGKRKVFDKFKALLPENTVTGEIDFKDPAKDENAAALKQKTDEWLKTLGA